MMDPESLTLTVDEIATTKLAVRILRVLMAVGLWIALPVLLILALPVVSYALLAVVLLSPILIGVAILTGGRRGTAATT